MQKSKPNITISLHKRSYETNQTQYSQDFQSLLSLHRHFYTGQHLYGFMIIRLELLKIFVCSCFCEEGKEELGFLFFSWTTSLYLLFFSIGFVYVTYLTTKTQP